MLSLLVAALLIPAQQKEAKPIAFINATVLPISSAPIEHGVLIVVNGKISFVGPEKSPIPKGTQIVDLKGKIVMPGLVDTHSHIGGWGGADASGPIQPDARIYDAINVRDSGFRRAAAGGITTLNIMPGSGHLMSGQTIYAKNRIAKTVDGIIIRDNTGWIMGGMKMANGTNPIGKTPFPGTRSKSMALVREEYVKALEYKRKWDKYRAKVEEGTGGEQPERDLGLDAMVEVLNGKRIVHHHTHRADDIMSVLRLQKEFGFKLVLHHVSEAWKVADEIAAAHVPCSIITIDSPGGKLEAVDLSMQTGAELEKRGINVGYHTDDWITDSRLFLRCAAMGVRGGMTRSGALRSVTLAGAEMLGLQDRIGSLEAGKDADFIILNGDPLSVYSKVLETWIEGKKIFDRSNPKDLLYATGGFGASHNQDPYLCCAGGHVGDGHNDGGGH